MMNKLHEYISRKDIVSLKALLDAGYDVDMREENNRTALIKAIIERETEIAKLCIEYGADCNQIDDISGITALHFAVQHQLIEVVKLLVENQADIEAVDVNGNTPLSDAVFYSEGKGEIIKLLLAHGADRNKENYHGVSPLSLAKNIGNYDLVKYFE